MSSDDEYYTNSVSRLRAITKKKSLESEPESTTNNAVILFSDEEDKKEEKKPNVVITVTDEEASTSLNIISVIDEVLQKNKRPTRRRKCRRLSKSPQKQVAKKPTKPNKVSKCIRTVENVESEDLIPTIVIEHDLSEDPDQMVLKVCWCFQTTEKFTVRRFEPLEKIFKYFADCHNIPQKRLLFTIGNSNQVISPTDTPNSLNLNVGSIIEGGFLNSDCVQIQPKVDDDSLELKVQLKDRKHPLFISMRATDSMEVLMRKCAEQLSIPVNELKFYFDGDLIQLSDTAILLELTGGECIDCVHNQIS